MSKETIEKLKEIAVLIDTFRVFPRIIMTFMAYMLWEFHTWFTDDGLLDVTEMHEWTLVGYASVIGAYVGLVKFYLDTGKNKGE